MAAIAQPGEKQTFSWFVFGLMASVTFVGILSELVPSGVLPQMSEGLGGFRGPGRLPGRRLRVGLCRFRDPLVSATLAVNRKKLLMGAAGRLRGF